MFVATKTVVGIALVLTAVGILIFGIISVTTTSSSIDRCDSVVAPYSVSVRKNNDEIVISWLEPWPNYECEASYHLQYRIDDQSPIEVNVTEPPYVVPGKLSNCSVVNVNVWTLSKAGTLSSSCTSQNYTEIPTNAYVQDVEFISSNVGLLMRWKKPSELARCDAYYTVNYHTELLNYSTRTDNEYVLIPHDQFCFRLSASIGVWVDEKISSYTFVVYDEASEIQDIDFSVTSDDMLIVSWTAHPNPKLCSVQYRVTYVDDAKQLGAVQTSDTQARFQALYCIGAQILLQHVSPFASLNEVPTVVDAPNTPIEIGIVSSFYVTQGDESTLVSWTGNKAISMCNVRYLVNLRTDLGNFTYEMEGTTKDFHGDLYCFLFDLKVRAIVGEVLGQPSGFSFSGLSSIEDLNLTKTTENTWIASWKPHVKQEQCNIEYYVTYWNGAVQQNLISEQASVIFDVAPCNYVNVTVRVVSNGKEGAEQTISRSCTDLL